MSADTELALCFERGQCAESSYLKACESRKINQLFGQKEGSFYKELRSKLDQQKETSTPLYKCKETSDRIQPV